MPRTVRPPRATVLALSVGPDPKRIPEVRHALRRWLLRHGLGDTRKVVELLTSELLARAVIHARSDVTVRVRDDDGVVRVDVTAEMTPEPQRLSSVAELAGRRGEAILSALARDHGVERHGDAQVLWAEVWVHRPRHG